MNFFVKCEIFARLAAVCSFFEPTTEEETRQILRCVRLENKNGHAYAISTNQKIASIQYLGTTLEPDGAAHVVVDPVLVEQCRQEAQYDSILQIVTVPEIAVGSATTMLGFSYNGNACIFPEDKLMDGWREWGPEKPVTVSRGGMFWTVDHILSLVKSSPTGKVYFPQAIDIDKPVVLRDLYEPNWVGLFMPKPLPSERQVREPAELPSWWKF